ncbi:MAG TPA: Nramp family divalent metal transporter, partial [Chloroflexota bacterium]|nr:Nramp family divalent metal transporter [Chloroflexota bacterium]
MRRTMLAGMAVFGPGLVAANAGNDAGGISTYSQAGAQFGYSLIWTMPVLIVSLIVVQEMAARMGAITGKGLSDLIRENFSLRITVFLMATLGAANTLLVISEFAGVAASTQLLFGGHDWIKYISVPLMAVALWLLITQGSYKRAERVFLFLTVPFLGYFISAWFAKPNWPKAAHGLVPGLSGQTGFLVMVVALVGTTITPYMQVYIQSAVAEKGVTSREYKYERFEVVLGSLFAILTAGAIMVCMAATLWASGNGGTITSAAQAAQGLKPFAGQFASTLFAAGLFGASMLAGAILPLSTSYAVGEAFGFETGVENKIDEAPVFYGIFGFLLVFGAAVALIPGLPLIQFIILAQVVNGLLLPIILVAIVRLVN